MIEDLRCDDCGSAELAMIAPGQEPDRPGDLFFTSRGEPMKGWCEACAVRRGWLAEAA